MANTNRPTIRIHNIASDEIIDREMNDAEFAEHQADLAANAKKQAEAEARATAKAALLSRLGISEDEAKLLLS
jgi:hypothetical protein